MGDFNDDHHPGGGGVVVRYTIVNAGEVSYPQAWDGSTVCWSTTPSDPNSWKRKLDTTYHGNDKDDKHVLTWTHYHDESSGSVYFSYFAPFSYERHLDLIAKCSRSSSSSRTKESAPGVVAAAVESLGQTLDGREIECIRVSAGSRGTRGAPLNCYLIHRQHPGESMAEYYAEGLLTRLLGLDTNNGNGGSVDGMVRRALDAFTFYIVPNMCPDGGVRGHLRTNACGANLNREWASTGGEPGQTKINNNYYEAPTLERSPEVYHVLKKMDETGVDVFLDVHGDEELPYSFLAGAEGCPNWGLRLQSLHGAFLAAYCRANSDMNQRYGYEPEAPGEGRLNTCSNQIATRFDCLAATLEMPFKDCWSNPDPIRGWNPSRARMLGASVLDALVYVHPFLRAEGEFWKNFPEADAYVRPTDKYKD